MCDQNNLVVSLVGSKSHRNGLQQQTPPKSIEFSGNQTETVNGIKRTTTAYSNRIHIAFGAEGHEHSNGFRPLRRNLHCSLIFGYNSFSHNHKFTTHKRALQLLRNYIKCHCPVLCTNISYLLRNLPLPATGSTPSPPNSLTLSLSKSPHLHSLFLQNENLH